MKTICIVILGVFFTSVASAGEHQIPTAPQEYLDMKNPVVEMDKQLLKTTGRLYKRKCSKCHGKKGDGKGYHAETIEIKPVAFSTPDYMASRKDGQLFWIMQNGSDGTEMVPVGSGTDIGLSEEQMWQLIFYLRKTFTN